MTKEAGYTYSVVAFATDGRTSRARISVQLPDTEPPHKVWDLTAGLTAPDTATVSWVNPSAEDLYEVVVRRSEGLIAPQLPSEGIEVSKASPEDIDITDKGLRPGQTYSYSVFALDEVGNHDGPSSASVTTPPLGVDLTGRVLLGGNRPEMNPPPTVMSGVDAISAGENHALALKDGGVIAWGPDMWDATRVPPEATSGIVKITAGSGQSLALTSTGKVLKWGYPCGIYCSTPAPLESGVTAIAAGGSLVLRPQERPRIRVRVRGR